MSEIPEFGTPRENEERRDGGCGIIYDPETSQFGVYELGSERRLMLFGGGVEEGEDLHSGILREVREESGLHDFTHTEEVGKAFTHYVNVAKKVNRVALATCLLLVLNSRDMVPTQREAHEQFELVWRTADAIKSDWVLHNGDHGRDHWFYFMENALARLKEMGYTVL